MECQELQESELARRQVDDLPGPLDNTSRRVNLEVMDAQHRILDLMAAPNQRSPDSAISSSSWKNWSSVMRALVRRRHQVKDPVLRIHDLEIDTSARVVKRAGQVIHLTPREFALLQFLAFHRGKVVTRTMIWEHLYDEYDENTSNVVDVYIRYLRTKVDNAFDKKLILTRWGEGYMLRGEEE